jgi:DnaJ-class molecular chaperone
MDYYEVLGVTENSSSDEIKKAYRKLSLKHHPDRKGNVETFKRINEAYQTLGDVQKRNMYKMRHKSPFGGGGVGGGADMDPLFKMFFGGFPGMSGVEGMPGMVGGMPGMVRGMQGMPQVQIFRNGQPINMRALQKPEPIIKTITISLEQSYAGFTYPLQIERWIMIHNEKRMEKEKLYVNINKGIDSGEIIMIEKKGNSINDKLKGDIKLFIKVENNTKMKREGINLKFKKGISLKESLTGFKFDIKHINGKTYTINNDCGNIIPVNYIKEIDNLGMVRKDTTGKLIIEFDVIFPDKLTEEQIVKLKDIL